MPSTSAKRPVLVVDDDVDIREGLTDLLEEEGYATAVARDGLEALRYLACSPPPPLILLDWNMAPMNGAQFMDCFVKQPAFARVPVVLLTADARAESLARTQPFVGHLRKPVKLDDLFTVVERYVGSWAE